MAQPNYTHIQIYSSSTPTNAPSASNLVNNAKGAEIAINIADGKLFYKDTGNIVKVLADVNWNGTVLSVGATAPIQSSGGNTPTISITQAGASTDGFLSSVDWNTFNNKAPATSGTSILYGNGLGGFNNVTIGTGVSFSGGTLSATGSGGTVTSVAALTIGTTGTDLSSTIANSTTTPVITLQVPTASATNRGALSSTDWSVFNSKQPALISGSNIKTVNGTTLLGSGDLGTINVGYGGTGSTSFTAGRVLFGNGTSALNTDAGFFWDNGGKRLGVNTGSPSTYDANLAVVGNIATANAGSKHYLYYISSTNYAAVSSSAGGDMTFITGLSSPAIRQTIYASGGVSIGNTVDPGANNLSVAGTIQSNSQINGKYNNTTGVANTAAQELGTNTISMVLISADTTLTTTVPAAGAHASVIIKTSGVSSRTVTFGSGFKSQGTLATGTTANRFWVVNFVSDGSFLYESSRTTTAYA